MDILCYKCGKKAQYACSTCSRWYCAKECEAADEKHKPICRPILKEFSGDQKQTFKIPVFNNIPHIFMPNPGGDLPFNAHDLTNKAVRKQLKISKHKADLLGKLIIIRGDQYMQVMRSFTPAQQLKVVVGAMMR